MKRNLLSAFITLSSILFITLFASCGDSYSPITLTSIDEKTTVSNNDTIKLTKFTEGEEFSIKGGSGNKYYIEIIKNDNKENISYSYNGNTLVIKPEKEGSNYLSISDDEKNESRIMVVVQNKNRLYIVKSVKANIKGDNLAVGEMKELEQKIINDSFVKAGGQFEFTYTSKDFNNGTVIIKTSKEADDLNGIFYQTESYDQTNGNKIINFEITFPDKSQIIMDLSEKAESNVDYDVISIDVTNKYKPEYPNLEKATIEYELGISSSEGSEINEK